MTEKEEYFKDLLTQMLLELLTDAHKTINSPLEMEERYPDFLDLALYESNSDVSLHITERQSNLIKKIKYSLEKLKTGEFGICEECGKKITEERLIARPIAALCIGCKRKQEKFERVRGL